mmetsp:Transcript_130392/g.260125  ORF Transcript_130392/g.260125 Transcript_130392/m.260125 type:complete len:158 (-) Transcript_130392:8-481(-)
MQAAVVDTVATGTEARHLTVQQHWLMNFAVAPNQVRTYVARSGYCQGPAYLRRIKGVLEEEQQYIEALSATEEQPGEPGERQPVRLLTAAERRGLVEGLHAKREQLERCFANDFDLHHEEAWKRRVRDRYEPQIVELDRDIERLNQPYIFVASEELA